LAKRPAGPVQRYTRADAARLRQDNIELRAQVAQLQTALDRAKTENGRLLTEVQKLESGRAKQASIIAYLKEEKLYGKR
jgi:cell division protein FtsB